MPTRLPSPRSNRVTGVYELSLCHVADAGSPGRRLGGGGTWLGARVPRGPSAKLPFWGALTFETHVLTFAPRELF